MRAGEPDGKAFPDAVPKGKSWHGVYRSIFGDDPTSASVGAPGTDAPTAVPTASPTSSLPQPTTDQLKHRAGFTAEYWRSHYAPLPTPPPTLRLLTPPTPVPTPFSAFVNWPTPQLPPVPTDGSPTGRPDSDILGLYGALGIHSPRTTVATSHHPAAQHQTQQAIAAAMKLRAANRAVSQGISRADFMASTSGEYPRWDVCPRALLALSHDSTRGNNQQGCCFFAKAIEAMELLYDMQKCLNFGGESENIELYSVVCATKQIQQRTNELKSNVNECCGILNPKDPTQKTGHCRSTLVPSADLLSVWRWSSSCMASMLHEKVCHDAITAAGSVIVRLLASAEALYGSDAPPLLATYARLCMAHRASMGHSASADDDDATNFTIVTDDAKLQSVLNWTVVVNTAVPNFKQMCYKVTTQWCVKNQLDTFCSATSRLPADNCCKCVAPPSRLGGSPAETGCVAPLSAYLETKATSSKCFRKAQCTLVEVETARPMCVAGKFRDDLKCASCPVGKYGVVSKVVSTVNLFDFVPVAKRACKSCPGTSGPGHLYFGVCVTDSCSCSRETQQCRYDFMPSHHAASDSDYRFSDRVPYVTTN